MSSSVQPGRVLLVGAGPGPVDLMTVRAMRAVQGAGALLYDALCSEEVVALAPPGCIRIQTGKRAGKPSMTQHEINRIMLRLARRGLRVVRLKGGDPSIFGRVGEEAAFLSAYGIATEMVPGVTAACAAAAQFGFPLTHRGQARRVVFTTARVENGAVVGDWRSGADAEATIAIYMGGEAAPDLAKALVTAGRATSTPVAVIERAGAADARLTTTSLGTLTSGPVPTCGGPVLIVVGEVAALAQDQTSKAVERLRDWA